jgi:hypothetical protein
VYALFLILAFSLKVCPKERFSCITSLAYMSSIVTIMSLLRSLLTTTTFSSPAR